MASGIRSVRAAGIALGIHGLACATDAPGRRAPRPRRAPAPRQLAHLVSRADAGAPGGIRTLDAQVRSQSGEPEKPPESQGIPLWAVRSRSESARRHSMGTHLRSLAADLESCTVVAGTLPRMNLTALPDEVEELVCAQLEASFETAVRRSPTCAAESTSACAAVSDPSIRGRRSGFEPGRDDGTGEAPLVAQDRAEEACVLGAVCAMEAVVGRHHRPHVRLEDGGLEGSEVDLAQRALADLCARAVALQDGWHASGSEPTPGGCWRHFSAPIRQLFRPARSLAAIVLIRYDNPRW